MNGRLADSVNIGPVQFSDAEVGGLDAHCSFYHMRTSVRTVRRQLQ